MNPFQEVLNIEKQRPAANVLLGEMPSFYQRNANSGKLTLAQAIAIEFTKRGYSREKRLAYLSELFGRPIGSIKELTIAEARTVKKYLGGINGNL